MDGFLIDVFTWATSTLHGVAFIEFIILGAVVALWREMRVTRTRMDEHETTCHARAEEAAEWRGCVNATLTQLTRNATK